MLATATMLLDAALIDIDRSGNVSVLSFALVLGFGFLVATIGHIVQAKVVVAFGISVIFGATVLVPAILILLN